jgi:hypothetical protein
MRKGDAVGAGPVPERQPASDPCFLGATPLPAPPRRVGLQALGRATVLRRRGLGLGTVGAGSAGGSWSGAWPGNAGSEPPLMDFFERLIAIVSVLVRSLSPPLPPPPRLAAAMVVVVVVLLLLLLLVFPPPPLSLVYVYVCMYICTFHSPEPKP